ncbi:Predicted arabinose efflux permease, MFS family [Pseudomonas flavescens]|uniref:Predicted arabinose efflux permease, MFS family n=1 Tax=Phytopseudomonas flavescens TaxID=29435 RepID=A0A1G8IWU7_9GAMM|nr:Predicted arabinose efflux permease, MFS family [Pseudomonas flavescens]
MLLLRNPALLILFFAQALYWSCSLIGITLTALIGLQLSPYNSLATLPLALLVLGNLLATHPLSLFMQRHGRRPGLTLGAAAGILGGLVSALGVWLADFNLFCVGALPIGVYQASAMYYRFAALETVDEAHKGRAAAWVIGGGVCAALFAPTLTLWARNALSAPFVGAYLLLAVLALLGLLLLSALREGTIPVAPRGNARELLARPAIRSALAITAIGHGLMILVMNATPLAMSFCGLSVESAAQVIQWHMLGMFLPALIAGPLVDRLGGRRVAMIGIVLLSCSASSALIGQAQVYFLISSLLLGIGWNLMLVAGTTLLARAHGAEERGRAQGLMELANGSVAACAAFASGALITGLGWGLVNLAMLPLLAIAVVAVLGRPAPPTPLAS